MKKLICLLLSVMMVLAMSVTVFAAEAPSSTEIAADAIEFGIPLVYFDNPAEYEQYLTLLGEKAKNSKATRGATNITAAVVRSGTTDDCELYMNWTGTDLYSGFRFKEMKVKSTSLLFGETYGTFGNGTNYTYKYVVAAAVGSVKIGDLDIDSDVEKVKVTCKDLQGYNLTSASWLSAVELTGTVTIN